MEAGQSAVGKEAAMGLAALERGETGKSEAGMRPGSVTDA